MATTGGLGRRGVWHCLLTPAGLPALLAPARATPVPGCKSLAPRHSTEEGEYTVGHRAPISRRLLLLITSAVQRAIEGVIALGLELFRHRRRRGESIKPMKRPRIHVELGRHARLDETLRVLDIFVDKQVLSALAPIGGL